MFETEESILIHGSLEKVYAVAETYPKFVPFYKTKAILFEDNEKVIVRISAFFYGKELCWEGIGIKGKNKFINFTQSKGLLKGLKADWLFEDVDDKLVRVTIKSRLELRFFGGELLEKIIGDLFVKGTLVRILSSLKLTAENNSINV